MSEPLSIEQINKLQEENKELREQLDRAESGEKNEMDIANEYKKTLEEISSIINKYTYSNFTMPIPVMEVQNIKTKLDEALK